MFLPALVPLHIFHSDQMRPSTSSLSHASKYLQQHHVMTRRTTPVSKALSSLAPCRKHLFLIALLSFHTLQSDQTPTSTSSLSHASELLKKASKKDKKGHTSRKEHSLLSHHPVSMCSFKYLHFLMKVRRIKCMKPLSRLQISCATSHNDRKDLSKHSNTQESSVLLHSCVSPCCHTNVCFHVG